MRVSGWGNYPRVNAKLDYFDSLNSLEKVLKKTQSTYIARGAGRSYGDSALAPTLVSSKFFDYFVSMEEDQGIVWCTAGVTLEELLDVVVPKGWFLPVCPGTRFVSVGGAVASDIHGKNHHFDGCLSQHVIGLKLFIPDYGPIYCDATTNPVLFRATCGGQGLTGIILEVGLKLIKIESPFIKVQHLRFKTLDDLVGAFESHSSYKYSVAWIDCVNSGSNKRNSILMLGEHVDCSELSQTQRDKNLNINIPFYGPSFLLNEWSMQIFNNLYYKLHGRKQESRLIDYKKYFFPLDAIGNWNRLYGKRGFFQYQFVVPKSAGIEPLRQILAKVVESGKGSFLAVLKVLGSQNQNYLSFPIEGYTLAIDFKYHESIIELIKYLNEILIDYGGRVYLAKDALLDAHSFRLMYPEWEIVQEVRDSYSLAGKVASLQSKRLGFE
jgi:FAD/FMN-containing dehydrogenase